MTMTGLESQGSAENPSILSSLSSSVGKHMRDKKRHYYWTKRQTPVIQSTKTPAAQHTPSTNDNLSAKAEQPNADSPTRHKG